LFDLFHLVAAQRAKVHGPGVFGSLRHVPDAGGSGSSVIAPHTSEL
jgi:hypothetical protein